MRFYRLLSKISWLNYPGKILIVTFLGIHVPLITVVIVSLMYSVADLATVLTVLGILLVATLVGTGLTLYVISDLLKPILTASRALREYRLSQRMPALPTGFTDEAGLLMRDTQNTIRDLDGLLMRLTHSDPESGLPNRYRLRQLFHEQIVSGERIAVVALRVENRAEIEAFFDIDTGTAMLNQFTERLTREPSILVAGRVAPGLFKFSIRWKGRAETERELKGMSERMSAPVSDGRNVFYPRLFMGVATVSEDLIDADALMAAAISAMSVVVPTAESNIYFYSVETEKTARRRFHMDQELREAIGSDQFQLNYQPVVDFAKKKVVSAEALVRWHHPTRGPIPPSDFIPVAEAAGIIVPLGAWILKTACRQAALWSDELINVPRIAINISARQFRDPGLLATIDEAVAAAGIAHNRLKLEITESVLLTDIHLAKRTIGELQSRGITVSLDDFGAEYSNLRYVANFNFDEMKVDMMFVRNVDLDNRLRAICTSIVTLSDGLNIPIVAEGVERPEEIALLHGLGCEMFQGYFFSKPVTAAEFPAAVRRILTDMADPAFLATIVPASSEPDAGLGGEGVAGEVVPDFGLIGRS
ncbi:EAL domain-containing protein (putative c-di-GMP-specific phosphodiesterase class I)/GGDEF domain-containing protein [Amorphus suaedae]